MADISLLPRKRKFCRKVVSKRKFGELKLPDLVDQDLYNIVVVDGGVKTLPLPDSDLNRAHSVSISGSSSSAVYGGVKALASPDLDMERASSGSKFGFPSNSSGVNPLERAITGCIYDNCDCGGSRGLSDSDLEGSGSKSGFGGGFISLHGGDDYEIEIKMRIGLKLDNNRSEEDLFDVWADKFHENVLECYDIFLDGIEPKDRPMWERYYKQIIDSDGYDITYYPGSAMLAPIMPLEGFKDCPNDLEIVTELTDAAINEINKTRKEDDDEFEVHDILTVTLRGGMISWYYITFEAKKKKNQQGGAPLITTFQTRVGKSFYNEEVKVKECRIKGPKTSVLTTNPAQEEQLC